MGVVLRSRYSLELSGRDQFTHQNAAAPFDALPSIVGELHFLPVEGHAVAENRKDGARTQNVGVESLLLERVVLCKSRLIYQVHRLLHRVADILVVRRKREKIVVEHLHMALGLHIEGLLHGGLIDKYRHVAVQHIDLLLRIRNHRPGGPDARHTDDDTPHEKDRAENPHQLDLVLQILDYHTLLLFVVLPAHILVVEQGHNRLLQLTQKRRVGLLEYIHVIALQRYLHQRLLSLSFPSHTRYVYIRHLKTGEEQGFFMTIVPSLNCTRNYSTRIERNTYLYRDKYLSGYVLFHNMDGTFANGWEYKDGQIVGRVFSPRAAKRLGLDVEDFGKIALTSKNPTNIAARCTVFAESDLVHKIQMGYKRNDIIAGLCYSVASNYLNNVGKGKKIEGPIIFQGGVSKNIGVKKAFEDLLHENIIVDQNGHLMGAIGSAILARKTGIKK